MNNLEGSRRVVKFVMDILPPALVGGFVGWVFLNAYIGATMPPVTMPSTSYEACSTVVNGVWGASAQNIENTEEELEVELPQGVVSRISSEANSLKMNPLGSKDVCMITYMDNNGKLSVIGPYQRGIQNSLSNASR